MPPDLVLHLRDRRPVWSMPEWVPDRVRGVLPDDWEVVAPRVPAEGSGDGADVVPSEILESVRDARVYVGLGVPAEVIRAGEALEWVHTATAGVGASLTPEILASDVLLTNSAGIHGPAMAETVVAMALHFRRGLDFAVRGQERGEWWTEPFLEADSPIGELGSSVVGVLGYGGVGREVARRFSVLGARVLALRRHPPDASDAHAEVLHGEGGLQRILGRSDVLIVTLPETPETRGLLDGEALARMKPGSVLVNVARGDVLDEEALIEVLRDGPLRGAGLDVFAREPLPSGHPLWELPNVLLTPHVSAVTPEYWRRETELILENVERFLDGRPLLNVVDKELGY